MIRLLHTLDRIGFGYAANIRGPVHYLSGCSRRVPLVVGAGVVMAVLYAAGLAYDPPTTVLGGVWEIVWRLSALWCVWGQAKGVARELDAGPSATLPRDYLSALWLARVLMAVLLGALGVGIGADLLNIDLGLPEPTGPPFSFLAMLAMMAGGWIATHQGRAGNHTLAGHVRQLWALRHQPVPAGVNGRVA